MTQAIRGILLLAGVSSFSEISLAQVQGPQYVNLYWGRQGGTIQSWNQDLVDLAPNLGTWLGSETLTIDFLESISQSMLQTAYWDDLQGYGVTNFDRTLIPGILESNCGDPPLRIDDANNGLDNFLHCVLTDPGNSVSIRPGNVVFTIFYPPWVGAATSPQDFCDRNGEVAYNDNQQGHNIAVIPLNSRCTGGNVGFVLNSITHEMVETTCGDRAAADNCGNTFASLPFLGYTLGAGDNPLASYNRSGSSACVPAASEIPNPPIPPGQPNSLTSGLICGSGANMVIQALLDPRFHPPWDLSPAFSGSMYVGFVESPASRAPSWSVGFSHALGDTICDHNTHRCGASAAQTGRIDWSQSGTNQAFLKISGFGGGYGTSVPGGQAGQLAVVAPGDSVVLTVFDTDWGVPVDIPLTPEQPASGSLAPLRALGTVA